MYHSCDIFSFCNRNYRIMGIFKTLLIAAAFVMLAGIAIGQHIKLDRALELAELRDSIIKTMIVPVKRLPGNLIRK